MTATAPEKPKSKVGGARPGAGAPPKPVNSELLEEVKRWSPAFRKVMNRFTTLGLTTRQVIFELHVRQGKRLIDVAHSLGLAASTVSEHWKAIREDIAANASATPEMLASMRQVIAARLEATIEETYPQEEDEEEGDDIDAETGEKISKEGKKANPALLAIRLKALDQLATLYGVKLEQQPTTSDSQPYTTPAEIAESVKARILELHQKPVTLLGSGSV